MTKNYHCHLFLSVTVALGCFCGSSIEAFTTKAPSRSLIVSPLIKHSGNSPLGATQPLHSSSSALNLFPFSRNPQENRLQRRLSDDDDDEANDGRQSPRVDALVELVSRRMRRISSLSWWVQVILTTVSAVTLLFTKNVLNLETNPASKALLLPNYFLAGSSIAFGIGSIFWTWATRRLSRRLLRKPTTRIQAANMLRKDITVGTCLNLFGMALAIFGAEQIVGGLAIKVLTTSTSAAAVYQTAQAANLLQPLDILVVQANTNTLFSHFCSVVAYLFLSRSIGQLDPPSIETDERPRD